MGQPGRAKGEEIPLPMRIVHVARDGAFQRMLGGPEVAARVLRKRARGAFDPAIAMRLADGAAEILSVDESASVWDEDARVRAEPAVDPRGRGDRSSAGGDGRLRRSRLPVLGRALTRCGRAGAMAAERSGTSAADLVAIRRAALVHDIGRVAVPARIWQKPGPADARRLGEGKAPRLSDRAYSRPFAIPGRAFAPRHLPSRAARWLGIPPGSHRSNTSEDRAADRGRGCVSRNDRGAAPPSGAVAGKRCRGADQRGSRRTTGH